MSEALDQALNSITDINLRLIKVTNRVGTLEGNVNFLIDTVAQNSQDIARINLQLQQHQDAINQLNNTVNTMNTNLNDLINQYKPIMGFTYNSVSFTDYHGNFATGNFCDAWYRLDRCLSLV
jgi:methyl-accepting chemotaxis protein